MIKTGTTANISKGNSLGIIYVKGNANTDGSLRLVPDILGLGYVEFQQRLSGVWRETGVQAIDDLVFANDLSSVCSNELSLVRPNHIFI